MNGDFKNGIRTVFIFIDLPIHFELRSEPLPILEKGTVIEFELLRINDPGAGRSKTISGPYVITRVKLVYSSKRPSLLGLTQYVEMLPQND